MLKDYIKLHVFVLLFGFTGILGKLISVDSLTLVLYRTLFAALGLFVILYFRKVKIQLSFRDFAVLFGTGLVLGLHWLCFFGSGKLSTVSVSLVTFSTTSFFTGILEPFFFKKKMVWYEIVLGIIVVIGVSIMFSFEIRYLTGILVGLLGALLAAVFSIVNSRLTHRFDSQVISLVELSAAMFFMGVIFLFAGDFNSLKLSQHDLFWLLILSWVCTVIPYSQMISLMRRISVFTANLSLNLEPVYGVILAYFIFGESEKMSFEFYLGGILVLLTVMLHPILKRRFT
jgi:drug/metabolite transporter (DMT)-like permease